MGNMNIAAEKPNSPHVVFRGLHSHLPATAVSDLTSWWQLAKTLGMYPFTNHELSLTFTQHLELTAKSLLCCNLSTLIDLLLKIFCGYKNSDSGNSFYTGEWHTKKSGLCSKSLSLMFSIEWTGQELCLGTSVGMASFFLRMEILRS